MMKIKFKDYLNDIDKFRKLKVGLVKKPGNEIITLIKDNFDLGVDLLKLINELNSSLSKNYTGKFKFDFCLIEDINIDMLKVKRYENKVRIKEEFFKVSDSLAKAQTKIEKEIKNNI